MQPDPASAARPAAVVYLVGAGPGDPGLITLRGVECLGRADLVLYDYLANPALLDHARSTAERVCLGHHRTGRTMSQDEVNARMVEAARAGRVVVRLKGGDPSIFARTADELAALRAAGVPYEIVPGITSGLAAGSGGGSAVGLVTGHERPGKGGAPFDYGALAGFPGKLVFYMGVTSAPNWSRVLVGRGLSPETPVAVVRHCTRPEQEVLHFTLGTIGEAARRREIRPPALLIIDPEAVPQSSEPAPATPRGLLLAAHGARDDRTVAAARAIASMTAEHLAGVPVELGFLEFTRPTIAEGLARLAEGGVRQATLVPLFLARGAHVERDIPAIVDEFSRGEPSLSVQVAQHVGAWPEMADLAAERTQAALASCGAVPAETALLLVAHGSRREGALEESRRFTAQLATRMGVAHGVTVFAVMGRPGLDEVLPAVERLSVRAVVVYPQFLFPGQMTDTVEQMLGVWRGALPDVAWHVAAPPGPAPALAAAIARCGRAL